MGELSSQKALLDDSRAIAMERQLERELALLDRRMRGTGGQPSAGASPREHADPSSPTHPAETVSLGASPSPRGSNAGASSHTPQPDMEPLYKTILPPTFEAKVIASFPRVAQSQLATLLVAAGAACRDRKVKGATRIIAACVRELLTQSKSAEGKALFIRSELAKVGKKLETERDRLLAARGELARSLQASRRELNSLGSAKEEIQAKIVSTKSMLRTIQSDNLALEEQCDSLLASVGHLQERRDAVHGDVAALRKRLAEAEAEIEFHRALHGGTGCGDAELQYLVEEVWRLTELSQTLDARLRVAENRR